MDFLFNTSLADAYHSATQKARVLTEDWLGRNMYCPICGTPVLRHFEANRPVADFYCTECRAEYELKSTERKRSGICDKINDGEYNKMISRITALNNPNFFILTHTQNKVRNLVFIPNYFFVPEIIEKRKPLSEHARRAGWTGCNINISTIPQYGKIYIIKDSIEIKHTDVLATYKHLESLRVQKLESRGWLMDVLQCVDKLGEYFSLDEMYNFIPLLQTKHPNNHFVDAKIRQQLQMLRDKGFLEFTHGGHYRKLQ